MDADLRTSRVHLDLIDGVRFDLTFPDLPGAGGLTIDEEPPVGTGAGPNPAGMLGAAIGGCLAASLTFCLTKARVSPSRVSADVRTLVTRNERGRWRVTDVNVDLSVEVASGDAARLERCGDLFQDFCIVTESVRRGIPVTVQVGARTAEHAA